MIVRKIKRERQRLKLNQEEFSKLIGSDKYQYGRWERGAGDIPSNFVKKICLVTNITPNDLFGWDDVIKYGKDYNRTK
jgi:transcriptional regulator with XRE-family HTH domain